MDIGAPMNKSSFIHALAREGFLAAPDGILSMAGTECPINGSSS